MITEIVILKGVPVVASFVAHHVATTKLAVLGYKIWQAHKIGEAVAIGIGICATVGATKYTIDCIKNIKNGATAVSEGRYRDALFNFAKVSTFNSDLIPLPVFIEHGLENIHISADTSIKVSNWIRENEKAVLKYATNL